MAMKTPSVATSLTSSVLMFRSLAPVTAPSPRISSTTESQITPIFGFDRARSCMIFEARNSSRRWTIVTLLANLVRKVASSMAVSPPPTTRSSRSRKKNPSQVAQAETPRPRSRSSPGMSSHLALAPVATISVRARHSSSPDQTPNGRAERSTRVAMWGTISVSKRAACFSIASISSGPRIPSAKPG